MSCLSTGLITPPYSNQMQHYQPSSKSDSTISDLCAQTVCFLWFESLPTLHEAASQAFPHPRLPDVDSLAKPEFIRWTKEVLSTTQVSNNVVILAMLFIYRLKLANPTVKGKAGSEYRLLTVALMLGNKFLDDNTYTNKTWAEVTSISVKEIHLMEVEFLSNVRYQLMVTCEEWQQWLSKINAFVCYQQKQLMSMVAKSVNLPSPPALYDSYAPPVTSNAFRYQNALMNPMQQDNRGRKRSLGDYSTDILTMLPPHKRIASQPTTPKKLRCARASEHSSIEISPTRKHESVGQMPRALPSHGLPHKLAPPSTTGSCGPQSLSSLSPSYLQVGAFMSGGSSPTNSSISHFSTHSQPAGYAPSPTSFALHHRSSPYAPVQPVQRLVNRYQPSMQALPSHSLQQKQSLWYSQIAAGNQHPMYPGQVPLSAHGSPFVPFPRY